MADVARRADIIITITPSRQALLQREWIRPGTHINAMGADTAGKQELDPALVQTASIVVDDAEQAITIGECQHAYRLGLIGRDRLGWTLGAVISPAPSAGSSAEEITLFDGPAWRCRTWPWRCSPIAARESGGLELSCASAEPQAG